ncbi:MAG: L-seryl-tRNA(Sec) selenium transferase, partial [Eubacteriales bacterium]
MNKNEWYRSIPKVDVLLEMEEIQSLIKAYSRDTVLEGIRVETEKLRGMIGQASEADAGEIVAQMNALASNVEKAVINMHKPNMTSTINATGTILHTNLGRAPIGEAHMEHVAKIATGYSNLEYNLSEGRRGERYSHFEELLC